MSDCRHNAPGRELETGDAQTKRQQLDDRTTEEMLDRLVDCLYNHDGDADISAIDRCLEDLEQAGAECEDFDVEQGLMKFHERFDEAFEIHPEVEVVKPSKKRRPLAARIAIIAAAMCIFVVTAQASGWDIIGAIAQWTSEQFAFVTEGDQNKDTLEAREFASLQEALEFEGVSEQLSPTQFPNGTQISNVQVKKENGGILFSASYDFSGRLFYISIRKTLGTPYSEVEINDPNVEVYLAGGIEHHLVNDVKQRKASWCNGNWECYIAGNLSRDDLVVMIDSIYE